MSLTSENGNIVMPVGPMGNFGGGYGTGFGDSLFWIIVLFLFAFMGNGFGNGFGGGGMMPFMMNQGTNSDVQRGFDQQAIMGGINGINAGINSLAQGQCSGFAGVTAAVNNGFSAAEIAANGRQMANMQQDFASQTAIQQQLNGVAMTQQNCCCENRAAVADLKYTMAQEASATRANTDAKVQMVMDKLCQLELDGVKQNYENRIAGMQNQMDALRQELNNARFDASQIAQTGQIVNRINPTPVPSYPAQYPGGQNCGNCSNFWNSNAA